MRSCVYQSPLTSSELLMSICGWQHAELAEAATAGGAVTCKPLNHRSLCGLTTMSLCCAGLGGVLSLLKERGELEEKVHWAGRANDKKKVALIGLGESWPAWDPFLGHQAGHVCCLLDGGGWLHCRLQHATGVTAPIRPSLCSITEFNNKNDGRLLMHGRFASLLPVCRFCNRSCLVWRTVCCCTLKNCKEQPV